MKRRYNMFMKYADTTGCEASLPIQKPFCIQPVHECNIVLYGIS